MRKAVTTDAALTWRWNRMFLRSQNDNCDLLFAHEMEAIQLIIFFLILFTIAPSLAQLNQQQFFQRFEYKHSFRTPNLAQRDGTIPFWTVAGDAIASASGNIKIIFKFRSKIKLIGLRLAPSMRSRKGLVCD